MSENVQEITESNFDQEVLKAETLVVVDFWAPWCGPCKSIAPVLEELAKEYSGKLRVVKMNVDDFPQTAFKYEVRGIPNLVFFKGGAKVEQLVGARPKDQLVAAIKKLI